MPTLTNYTFTQEVDYPTTLAYQIQNSAIATSLNHIDTEGYGPTMTVNVWFNDVLSTQDVANLNSIMAAYTNASPVPPAPVVTTQFELNNKDLKLARAMCTVDSSTCMGVAATKIPGTFGTAYGRYVAGGYAISADYNPDDYVCVRIQDNDRLIALALAQAQNPSATTPLSDATVQGMGAIPGYGAFPQYPIIKSYTDDDMEAANQGWYFWPNANGSTGFADVEPIGGYGFIPAGLYVVFTYQRPAGVTTGSCRINYYWGKME